jgi:hypothetical protein
MAGFWIGVGSSLLASVVLFCIAGLASGNVRRLAARMLGHISNGDLVWVYPDKVSSTKDCTKDILRSGQVRLICGRGNELQRDVFAFILGGRSTAKPQLRVILPDPNASSDPTSWLSLRETELHKFDGSYGEHLLASQVQNSLRFLTSAVSAGRVDVRVIDFPHIARILITDDNVYVNSYPASAHGRESPVCVFRRGGPTYAQLERLFEITWTRAERPEFNRVT